MRVAWDYFLAAWPVLEFLLWVVGCVYVLGPVFVWLRYAQSRGLDLELVAPGDADMAADTEDALRQAAAALAVAGFEFRGYFKAPRFVRNARGFVAILEHPSTFDVAQVVVAISPGTIGIRSKNYGIAISAYFSDGFVVATTNLSADSTYPRRPGRKGVAFVDVHDGQQMHRLHRLMVERFGTGVQVRTEAEHDPAGFLRRGADEVIAHQVKSGYMYLYEKSGKYRPTVKGAVLMTYRLLWPWKQIKRWRNGAEARRLRREFGARLTGA